MFSSISKVFLLGYTLEGLFVDHTIYFFLRLLLIPCRVLVFLALYIVRVVLTDLARIITSSAQLAGFVAAVTADEYLIERSSISNKTRISPSLFLIYSWDVKSATFRINF